MMYSLGLTLDLLNERKGDLENPFIFNHASLS